MRDTVLCLCDYTGIFAEPWVEAGYRAILVDPQHKHHRSGPSRYEVPDTVDQAMPLIAGLIAEQRVAFVAAFPPCTDLAVSGARWFETKRQADPLFQAKAVALAEQCRTIGRLSGAPWFVETVSVLSSVWGKPDHMFDPCDYTGWELDDNYTKRTCLWSGGGFVMPEPHRHPFAVDAPDDRIHKAPPSAERANFRSATPRGFARAVFEANGRKAVAA